MKGAEPEARSDTKSFGANNLTNNVKYYYFYFIIVQ